MLLENFQKNRFKQIIGKFFNSLNKERYDMDIAMIIHHGMWSFVSALHLWIGISMEAPLVLILSNTPVFYTVMIILSMICICLHIWNIFFVNKPFTRVLIYFLDIIWGLSISLMLLIKFGPGFAPLFYLVWFVAIPPRKIYRVIKNSYNEYKIEERNPYNEEGSVPL